MTARGSGADRWLLGIDTATSEVVVAAGSLDGSVRATRAFAAGHRHGSHLLPAIESLIADEHLAMADLAGIVVGLGPGAFTGLRVGLATAKTLAHALGIPIVGVSSGAVLLAAANRDGAGARGATNGPLLLPAGIRDRNGQRQRRPP